MPFNKTLKFYGFHMKNIMQFFPEEKKAFRALIQLEIQSHEITLLEMECISKCNFPLSQSTNISCREVKNSQRAAQYSAVILLHRIPWER